MEKRGFRTEWTIGCLITVISCLALPARGSESGTVYFSDDFEQGIGKWSVAPDGWQATDLFCHSPTHCASESPLGDYKANENSAMAMKIQYGVNLSTSSQPVLVFWHRIGISYGDYGYVEVSEDSGFTWTAIKSYGPSLFQSTWSFEQIDLSAHKKPRILIRFRLRADDSWQASGWDVDDVEIRELDQQTLPFPLLDDFENKTGNWVIGGWERTESCSHTPTHCMTDSNDTDYPANACSDLMLAHPVDLSSSVKPVLSFWHRINVSYGDYGYVQISQDGGFTWKSIKSYGPNLYQSTWSFEQIDLSAYKQPRILIRFRLRADDSWQAPGWDIDDIEIREPDQKTLPFPLFDDSESGTSNWVSDSWELTGSNSCSPTHCITDSNDADYLANACSDLMLAHPIDLSLSAWPVLSFWHRICVSYGDYGYVQISDDDRFTWKTIKTYGPNLCQSTWSYELLDLSPYKQSRILVRFRLRADDSWQASGWDIDDVEIKELMPRDLQVEMTDLTALNCPTVRATVIVTDSSGQSVKGLHASNFSVFEGTNSQTATVVESNSQAICVSLVMDVSGSMGQVAIRDSQWAAEKFVNLMREENSGEIIKFADGVDVTQAYTGDKGKLIAGIEQDPNVPPSNTALFDALYKAILDTAAQPGCDSKAVVAMTDGKDLCSTHSATEIIDLAKRSGVRIFTVGLGTLVDEDVLKAIATLTGGIYQYAPTSQDLETIYVAAAGALQNQYIVSYQTAACGADQNTDQEHEVMIMVTAPQGFGQDAERFHCPAECGAK